MKLLTTFSLLIVLILGLISQNSYAQTGKVTGKVTDETGVELFGCNIILLNSQGGIVTGTTTDEKGDFTINNVSFGTYLIKAAYVGFATQSRRIEVTSESDQVFDFKMTESSSKLDEITITAGRKAEKISEAASNIQVIGLKSVEVAQEPTAFGLLKSINGIDYVETGLGQQQVNARGYASPFTGGMLTLVDNRSVSLPGIGSVFGSGMGVSQQDIKRVEVIVGPNSALYGSGAAQGVVNIITKNPKEYAGTSLVLKGGNRSQLGLSFRTSDLLGDKFGYKIGGERFTAKDFDQRVEIVNQGQATGIFTNPNNDIENSTVNGSLYFFPSNNTELVYAGGISYSNFVNQSNIGSLQIDDFKFWFHQFRANFSNFLNFGSAFFQANYTSNDLGNTYNLRAVAELVANGVNEEDAKESQLFVDESERFDMEFQHNFDLDKNNFITWGLQYTNTLPNSKGTILSDGSQGQEIKINEFGAYLQYENEMVKNLKLTASGRYDSNDVFGDQFSPKLGLSYSNNNHNLRAVYNKAFTSPPIQPSFAFLPLAVLQTDVEIDPVNFPGLTVPSVPVNMILRGASDGFTITDTDGNTVGNIPKLSPVETESYEFGYKGLLFEKLYLDITYYHTTYTNFISAPIPINNPDLILDASGIGAGLIPTGQGWASLVFGVPGSTPLSNIAEFPNELVLSYINFGKAKVDGIDIGAEYSITPNLTTKIAYSYAKYGDFEDVPAFIANTGTPNSPKNVWRGGLKYVGKKGVFAELSFRAVESYFFTGAQEYQRGEIPSFTVFNINGEIPLNFIKFSNTSFGVSLKNIFNNEHIELPGTPELGFLGSAYLRFDFDKKAK